MCPPAATRPRWMLTPGPHWQDVGTTAGPGCLEQAKPNSTHCCLVDMDIGPPAPPQLLPIHGAMLPWPSWCLRHAGSCLGLGPCEGWVCHMLQPAQLQSHTSHPHAPVQAGPWPLSAPCLGTGQLSGLDPSPRKSHKLWDWPCQRPGHHPPALPRSWPLQWESWPVGPVQAYPPPPAHRTGALWGVRMSSTNPTGPHLPQPGPRFRPPRPAVPPPGTVLSSRNPPIITPCMAPAKQLLPAPHH